MITGLRGAARLLRARAFHLLVRRRLNGVLAIGAHSRNWFHRIGLPDDRILPWAYFVGANGDRSLIERHTEPLAGRTAVRFCYAGRLGASKGIIPLLLALGELAKRHPRVAISLDIVGDGPLGPEVREISARQGELRTRLHGALLRTETMRLISSADWLVLPSTGKEGWGAVISEALMEGTRVVCSDRCGAAVVAAASGCGIVYSSEVDANLFSAVERALRAGPWTEAQRTRLIAWAEQNIAPRRAADFLLRTIAEGPAKPREEVAWDPAVKHPDFYARSY